LISARSWVDYAAGARGVEVDTGDAVVLTPVRSIFESLLRHFKPAPWEKRICAARATLAFSIGSGGVASTV